MSARTLALAALAVASCACGSGSDDRSGNDPLLVDTPLTVTGVLDVPIEEGPVGDDDISEVNFGSVETENGYVLVEIPAEVVRSSGVTRDQLVGGGRYEIDLTGASDLSDPTAPTYLVGALRRLDG